MNVAIVGGGWAGLAAAVTGAQAGHAMTLFEAARELGGRARALPAEGDHLTLDNGQHILIGAYCETLALMEAVGVDIGRSLLVRPLTLRFPDGGGLAFPRRLPPPLDGAWAIATARGWTARDKLSLARAGLAWRRAGFRAPAGASAASLCAGITPRVMEEMIEPLCVSALNVPASRADGGVFLRVLHDALLEPGWRGRAGSTLMLPCVDLGQLFPNAAVDWLRSHGAEVVRGHRVRSLERAATGDGWRVDGRAFDQVLLALPAWEAIRLLDAAVARPSDGDALRRWSVVAGALRHEAIATVYATSGRRLPEPMLALRSSDAAPAQFVFDRAQLGGPAGLLAFVVSASSGDGAAIEAQVIAQAHALGWTDARPLRTIVEKRATFACEPGVVRPPTRIAPGLMACGDHVEGPYPSTLEGAVRSARRAVERLGAASTLD